MGTLDGRIVGTTKIEDHGSPAERFNLVIISEGYQDTAADLTQFANDAQTFVNSLFATPPFDTFRTAFNIYRIDVGSTDSGADDPLACGGSGAAPSTYFDASFCNNGIYRLLEVNVNTVLDVVNAEVPQWHQILVIVNSIIYGGSGGNIAVTSKAGSWINISLHELGHAAFSLADEYEYYEGCGIDTNRNNHPNTEPSEPNVTINTNRNTVKWADLILTSTSIPTTTNANCALCDPQASPVPTGTVGLFEGAHYYHCDAFRPEFNCMMRNYAPFCAVCRRKITEVLTPYLDDCEWEFGTIRCIENKDTGYWKCLRTEDQGYQGCDRYEDHGYNQCKSWSKSCSKWLPWPLSYLCKLFEWVCIAWVWISNIVCVVWIWISNIVCTLWIFVSYIVCIVWPGRWIRKWFCFRAKERVSLHG